VLRQSATFRLYGSACGGCLPGLSGPLDEADEAGRRAFDVLPRGVGGAPAIGLVAGHHVLRHEPVPPQVALIAHAKKFAAVSSLLSADMSPDPPADVAARVLE
jgi:hypothetical protein